jgi:cytochrome P450
MMNDQMSQLVRGNTLCSDGAEHDALRGVIVRPLTSKALRPLREDIATDADAVVDRLVEQGSFDAVSELTQHLPGIVSKAIGQPEKGRDRMLVLPSRCSTASGR